MKIIKIASLEKQLSLPQYQTSHSHEQAASATDLVGWESPRQLSLRAIITTACNHRCSFCFREERPVGNDFAGELSKEIILRAAKEAAKHNIACLRLTGGEPLLRADIIDLVSSITSTVPIKVGLTTNGVLLNSMAQNLFNAGLRSVNVSVPAFSREVFETITGKDNFDKVLGGIEAALNAELAVKVNVPIVKRNIGEIGNMLEYFLRLSDVTVRLFSVLEYFNISQQDHVPESEIYAAAVEYCRSEAIRYHNGSPRILIRPYRRVCGNICDSCEHKTRCAENAIAIRLTPDGYLKPCLLNNSIAVNFASSEPDAFEKAYRIAMNLYNGS